MKKVEKVWAELSANKVELGELQKVELNKIQQIKALASEVRQLPSALDFGGDLDRVSGIVQELQREVRRAVTDARSIAKEFDAVYSDLEKAAKDLGMSESEFGVNNEIQEIEQMLGFELEMYEEIEKELPALIKAINRLVV